MSPDPKNGPEWNRLYAVAASQDGLFTTTQAVVAGYSVQLLKKHIAAGRVERVQRGIYRLIHFPAAEHADLTVLWLWSERQGVFSHETALVLQGLGDALPPRVHFSVPARWAKRRLRIPEGVVLHYADVPPHEQTWVGAIPVTAPARTLGDCIDAASSPELVEQGIAAAKARGRIGPADVTRLRRLLAKATSASS